MARVLDCICEKQMKLSDTNEVLAMKMHYLSSVLRMCHTWDVEKPDGVDGLLKLFVKNNVFLLIMFLNPLRVGFNIFFTDPITGLFSVKIQKKFLAIKNFSVNDTMSGQPNKRLIHWHFEN